MRISPDVALNKLNKSVLPFIELFKHGSLSVEVYKPIKIDHQKPHTKDEVYVIIDGQGDFFCGGDTTPFTKGDFLFVPAGVEHRFINFNEDFSTWVIFYGPQGGEGDIIP
jgi:mannose-6-phosphate isomerase-like protein (cupin superfamily)